MQIRRADEHTVDTFDRGDFLEVIERRLRFDLHASLGYPGETNNPKVMPVIDDAIRRIRKAGKAPGILTGVEADARRWIECGGLFVAVGADTGVLARETEKLAAKFK